MTNARQGATTRPPTSPPLLLSLFAGSLAALGQEPHAQPLLLLAGFALIFALDRLSPDRPTSARLGGLFAFSYFGFTLTWLIHPFQVDAASHGWLAPFALGLLAAGLALLWALVFWLAHTLTPAPAWRAATTALTLTAMEMLREHLLTGFPWALPGYTWTDQPIGQAAALVGIHGLTAITLICAALPFIGPRRLPPLLAALIILATLHGFGQHRLRQHPTETPAGPLLRLVQPNIPQAEKWAPDLATRNRDRLFDLSLAPSDTDPALILWPETAITWRRLDATPDLATDGDSLPPGQTILTGIVRQDAGTIYNTALLRHPDTPLTFTDKIQLVPFGEYVPFASLLARLGLGPLAAGDPAGFTPGTGPGLLAIDGIGPVRVLICYEAIFPGQVRRGPRPRALVQLTNDAWFGMHAGPHQHLDHSRMRSLELGLPLLRVANTGISVVTDGLGRILAHLPHDQAGIIDAHLPPTLPATPYARLGDAPLGALLALGLLLQTLLRVRNMAGRQQGQDHPKDACPRRATADCQGVHHGP